MISKITIHNIATYTAPVTIMPDKVNFFYGSNGSGKTSLSDLLAGKYLDALKRGCIVEQDNDSTPILVYNRNFVKDNFRENTAIRGIFTLGVESKEIKEQIESLQSKIKDNEQQIQKKKLSLDNFSTDQQQLLVAIEDKCWALQQKYGTKFGAALIGFRGSKTKFMEKCLSEFSKHTDNKSLPEIQLLYETAYQKSAEEQSVYPLFSIQEIEQHETNGLLSKVITGRQDIPIGELINALQNSDWIRQGLSYAEHTSGKCPFCQQALSVSLYQEISDFFDDSYRQQCDNIKSFLNQYQQFANRLIASIKAIIDAPLPIPGLDYTELNPIYESIANRISDNLHIIEDKIKAPSQAMEIVGLADLIQRLNEVLHKLNNQILKNNEIVANQKEQQKQCQAMIWGYFTHELTADLKEFDKKHTGKKKAINNITGQINALKSQNNEWQSEIEAKEASLTSVTATVSAINGLLKKFGFTGFELAENPTEKGTYKILRPDGTDAKETLSEGEYNFICFLYFYHLVYGSPKSTGLNSKKIVVIDDPISSLDSNVLFIISTLVRCIIDDCDKQRNGIQQVLVLTHNIYFHREITYKQSHKGNEGWKYWIISKKDNITNISAYLENPIQTSYELMWSELKDPDLCSRTTILNTLRRILEYYFNTVGGLSYEACINKFEGEDKTICKSLISCINEESHYISDDFHMCLDGESIEKYIQVFEQVFKKMGHESHYNMMMGKEIKIPIEGKIL